jgi:hypothetical protein
VREEPTRKGAFGPKSPSRKRDDVRHRERGTEHGTDDSPPPLPNDRFYVATDDPDTLRVFSESRRRFLDRIARDGGQTRVQLAADVHGFARARRAVAVGT